LIESSEELVYPSALGQQFEFYKKEAEVELHAQYSPYIIVPGTWQRSIADN
jgi:hypothetical protein